MAKLTKDEIVTLHVLKDKGESNCAIAKRLGVTEGAVRYHVTRAKQKAVDGRKKTSLIEQLGLQEAVRLWWLNATEATADSRPPNIKELWTYLVDEYRYAGSYKSVRKYCREAFQAPKKRPFRRIETPPGAQTQSDWLEATIDIGEDEPLKLYGFIMTLSHSRKTAVVWSRSMNQLAWHRVHNEAFLRLGGVAAVNRIDNLKTGVAHGSGPWGKINEAYQAYARTMGFHVDPHEVRQPQQKGKVERQVRSVKQLNLKQRFDSLEHLQRYTNEQLERAANRNVCPVTGKTVAETWEDERKLLRPLPASMPEPFDLIRHCVVHKDCTIRFEGRTYSVPFAYVHQTVEVRGCSGFVEIADRRTGDLLKQYERHTKERILLDSDCYEGDSTETVERPRPLGKMSRALQDLANQPVQRRSIDQYAALIGVVDSRTATSQSLSAQSSFAQSELAEVAS